MKLISYKFFKNKICHFLNKTEIELRSNFRKEKYIHVYVISMLCLYYGNYEKLYFS